MCLNLKVVLRDVNGNDSVWPIRRNEPFEKNAVFLAKEWEPGLRGTGGRVEVCAHIPSKQQIRPEERRSLHQKVWVEAE